jgi:hypothetical protein
MKSPKSRLILNRQTVVIVLLTVVSLLSAFSPYFRLDLQISKQIQSINSQIFTNIMWFVSAIGNQPVMVLIVGITSFLLFLFKKRTEAVFCSLASAGSALSGSFLKIIVDLFTSRSGFRTKAFPVITFWYLRFFLDSYSICCLKILNIDWETFSRRYY